MRQANMPWPAVVLDKVANKEPGQTTAAELPVLMIVTGAGKILYTSSGSQNADLGKVFAAIDQILAGKGAGPSAPLPES